LGGSYDRDLTDVFAIQPTLRKDRARIAGAASPSEQETASRPRMAVYLAFVEAHNLQAALEAAAS
jgi:hypothetical protein